MKWFELRTLLIMVVVFVILDLVWLGKVMSERYTKDLGYLANLENGKIQFNLAVGLLVQILIGTGLSILLMRIAPVSLFESIFWGAFIGLVIYGTYDGTNLSFIKNWPLPITMIDIAWGMFQGVIAGLLYFLL